MGKIKFRKGIYLVGQSILEIKVKEESKEVLFKAKSNIHDKKRIREILDSLRSVGIDIEEIMKIKNKTEDTWF